MAQRRPQLDPPAGFASTANRLAELVTLTPVTTAQEIDALHAAHPGQAGATRPSASARPATAPLGQHWLQLDHSQIQRHHRPCARTGDAGKASSSTTRPAPAGHQSPSTQAGDRAGPQALKASASLEDARTLSTDAPCCVGAYERGRGPPVLGSVPTLTRSPAGTVASSSATEAPPVFLAVPIPCQNASTICLRVISNAGGLGSPGAQHVRQDRRRLHRVRDVRQWRWGIQSRWLSALARPG